MISSIIGIVTLAYLFELGGFKILHLKPAAEIVHRRDP